MLGGYQIIDLSGMNIALSSDVVSITDQKVLRQLLALRDHIEENYNFTKPLNKKLKPVMIRLRDKESGEKLESALWGNLSIVDDNLSFNIDAIVTANPLKVLQINVVFEKKQDDDGNDYYDIKSAKYEYKGGEDVVTVTNIKNISSAIINKLDCGDIVLKKDSSGLHAYIVSFRSATGICLTYTDASCIETQSYDKVGQNWVYNSEDKTPNLLNIPMKLEEIKDANGRNRFIEGVITPSPVTGVTYSYAKWSLSGSHLIIVLAFKIAGGTSISSRRLVEDIGLPEWIMEKIYPSGSSENIVDVQYATAWEDRSTAITQDFYGALAKETSSKLSIVYWGSKTYSNDTYFRFHFDLLIDNE